MENTTKQNNNKFKEFIRKLVRVSSFILAINLYFGILNIIIGGLLILLALLGFAQMEYLIHYIMYTTSGFIFIMLGNSVWNHFKFFKNKNSINEKPLVAFNYCFLYGVGFLLILYTIFTVFLSYI